LPPGISNAVAVGANYLGGLLLRSDGSLILWGNNSYGQTNVPLALSNVIAISAGFRHNVGILGDGKPRVVSALPFYSFQAGDSIQLPALISGVQPMTYQWQYNGQNLDGQTNSMLLLQNIPLTSGGDYRVIASNALGVVTNAATTVSITRKPLRFETSSDVMQVTNGVAKLRLTGLAGAGPVILFGSTNLIDWSPIQTNGPVVGSLDFSDTAAGGFPVRFYQASEGP
jgi:hypothetical protein